MRFESPRQAIAGRPRSLVSAIGQVVVLLAVLALAVVVTGRVLDGAHHVSGLTVTLALLYFGILFVATLLRSFFLDVFVLFSVAFFGQRIIVLVADPGAFDYGKVITLEERHHVRALLFLIGATIAVLAGHALATLTRLRGASVPGGDAAEEVRVSPWNRIPFERFFPMFAAFSLASIGLVLFLALRHGAGVPGVQNASPELKILARVAAFASYLSFLGWVAILAPRMTRRVRVLGWVVVVAFALQGLLTASRGFAVAAVVPFVTVSYFLGRAPRLKLVLMAAGAVAVTFVLWKPITVLRGGFIDRSTLSDVFQLGTMISWAGFGQQLTTLSLRLNGYDTLLGFIALGRSSFAAHAGLVHDLIAIVNSFVPDSLIEDPEYIPLARLIPAFMRGIALENLGGHGENPTVIGMVAAYFPVWAALAFLLVWAAASERVMAARVSITYKLLYFHTLVLALAVGGDFASAVQGAYAGLLVIGLLYVGARLAARVGHRPGRRGDGSDAGRTGGTHRDPPRGAPRDRAGIRMGGPVASAPRSLRIALDGTAVVAGGGVTWLVEMVPALAAAAPDDEILVFVREDARSWFASPRENVRIVPVRLPRRGRTGVRLLWQQTVLPARLRAARADVLVAPFDVAPLAASCPVVLGVQNANPHWGPPAATPYGRRRDALLRVLTRASARRAARVFFVSEWAREVIGRSARVPPGRSAVVHLGIARGLEERARAREAPSGTAPHVLAVGSVRSHKDYDTLLEAWARLPRPARAGATRLVFVGPVVEPSYRAALGAKAVELKIGGSVEFVGNLPQAELAELYAGASALVLASHVETFALPLVEAMAFDVPVVASDIPVAREVCGEAACYYPLGDADALASQLHRVLDDASERERLTAAGRARSRQFEWARAAELTVALAREAVAAGEAYKSGERGPPSGPAS